jgi:hypothetical protein
LGTYGGTWLDAAGIYREWALNQRWCSKGPISERPIPGWLQEIPAWIWNRGRAREVVQDTIRLSEYLNRPVALDWYWWHGNPYDTMLPEYLPPRDGKDEFREAIRRLHRRNLRSIVYINGRCCDIKSQYCRRDSSIKTKSGEIQTERYCKYTNAELAVMCPYTDYWQETISDIVKSLNEFGLDGVYIDQISSAPPRPCFSTSHGHPEAGGSAWAEGNRSILERAGSRARSMNSEAMLCSEGCCEVYLDLLDAFLTLSPSYERMGLFKSYGDSWEPIPMFNSVYHEHVITFGTYASLTDPPYDELWPPRERSSEDDFTRYADQFDLEIARCLIFGQKPMIANFRALQLKRPVIRESLRFFREAILLHEHLEDHLVRGRYLGSIDLDVPRMHVDCLNRGIYTLPGEAVVTPRTVPSILTSTWKASDGSVAVVLANISHQSQILDLPSNGFEGDITRIEPDDGRCRESFAGKPFEIRSKHVMALRGHLGL